MNFNFTSNNRKKMIMIVILTLITYSFMNIFISFSNNNVIAQTYKYGSSGNVVISIQTKLKRWGYYNGAVDGKYGYNTYTSVKSFQRKNGLTPDGIAGKSTLSALGINVSSSSSGSSSTSSNQDLMLLARLINGEARGEPYEGQVAVGAVIMNRMRSPKFPNTLAGVIYQPGAFTAIVDGQINAELKDSSIRAARDALNGWDPSGGAIYYFNPDTATSSWIWSRPLIKIIGKHRFCS